MDFDQVDDRQDDGEEEEDDGYSGDEGELAEFMGIIRSYNDSDKEIGGSPPSQEQLAIKGLECHFNWIQSAVGHFRPHDFVRLRRLNEMWIEDTKDDSSMVYYKILTQNMIRALCAYLKGLYDDALDLLQKGLTDMKMTDGQQKFEPSHYAAYEWIINANRLVILNKLGDTSSPEWITLKKSILEQDCFGHPPMAAMLIVIKATYLKWFGTDDSEILDLLEQANGLDPDVPGYLLEIFIYLRHLRREYSFLSGPTKREESLILRAFELAPGSGVILRHLSTFYQDALKAYIHNEKTESTIVEEMGVENLVQLMISRAKEAAEATPESAGASCRYAEVLTYGKSGRKDGTADWKEAQEQFNYCLQKWPNNSEVLHKIGKLAIVKDFSTGIDYFKSSLKSNPENFPCLMDLVRYSYRKDKDRALDDLIGYLDLHADSLLYRPVLLRKLKLVKGSLFARDYKLMAAVECWAEGLGQPQTVDEIPKDALPIMFGVTLLDPYARFSQLNTLIRFLEKEIPEVEDKSNKTRSMEVLLELFKMEKVKREQRLRPCDADLSWRTSGPVEAAPLMPSGHGNGNVQSLPGPYRPPNGHFQSDGASLLGPFQGPSDIGNWRARSSPTNLNNGARFERRVEGSMNGNEKISRWNSNSSGFGSDRSERPRDRSDSSSTENGTSIPEWKRKRNGTNGNDGRRRGGGRHAPSMSDADENWRRHN